MRGSSAAPPVACPAHAPAEGASCDLPSQACTYEDCEGAGRSVTRCENGAWTVENAPCADEVHCVGSPGATSCVKGEVCLTIASGAIFTMCIPNSCGDGPIGCDCLQGCSGQCSLFASIDGVSISCNTCTSGLCP